MTTIPIPLRYLVERAGGESAPPMMTEVLVLAVQFAWACSVADLNSTYEVYDYVAEGVVVIACRGHLRWRSCPAPIDEETALTLDH